MRSFADDELTSRSVKVLKWILAEMIAYETTAPANDARGRTATNLKLYYQSPIQFATFNLQAEVYRSEGKWTECMDTMEGYWRYSGLEAATLQDAVAIPDIRERIRLVVFGYSTCLKRSVDEPLSTREELVTSLKQNPATAKQWLFIARIIDRYSELLLGTSVIAKQYRVIRDVGKSLE
jgi:hypothetical protein